ncbi:MAG: PQQ-dependent sugar dehydrogenase [bacterium]|nr:PQQ-dependent sugar dehydrogenase [bacterium]
MKKILPLIIIIVLAVFITTKIRTTNKVVFVEPNSVATSTSTTTQVTRIEPLKIIAESLEIPWDMAFLPIGDFLVSERPGRLVRIDSSGTRTQIPVTGVTHTAEGGLLGIELHPQFASNKFIYLYMSSSGQNGMTQNKVVRYVLENNTLQSEKIIIDKIPGAIYHDGGRIEFGPDGLMYITTGDATKSELAQNKNSLAGKILRLHDDGAIPADNPFGTAVYSYGHRNPQGLAWDSQGRLWETEHGRSGIASGYDELNLIEKGKNYGWPTIEGPAKKDGFVTPVLQSGATDTWAPASLAVLNDTLYFGGLRGETLYSVDVGGSSVGELKKHFSKLYGRIRTVRVGPDALIYFTTSNRDGRGDVKSGDDKIIRVDPKSL